MSDQQDGRNLVNGAACRPRMDYNNHLGALQGCMDCLGVEVEPAWLYGVTGYAFMINIGRGVCCCGPTAWAWQQICERTPSIGVDTSEFVLAGREQPDHAQRKEEAIAFTKARFAEGVPLYGAEFGYPEFYTVCGVGDEGFTYSHTNGLARTWETTFRTWEDFGTVDVGIVFVGAVGRSDGTADDHRAVADALDFALRTGLAGPSEAGERQMGLLAYDKWIAGLSDPAALAEGPWNHPDGTTHNAGFWYDCRLRAAQFLRLCPEKLSGKLAPDFSRAADEYATVAEALALVHALFPYGVGPGLPSPALVAEASEHLRAAREAESRGLDLLARIREAM